MAAVRLSAFRALAEAIEEAVLPLKGRVQIAPTDASPTMPFSDPLVTCSGEEDVVLVIERGRWDYSPMQASEHSAPKPSQLVVNVGWHQGDILLRLSSADRDTRDEIEDAILEFFLGQELRPGVLVTPVTQVTRLGDFVASWELDQGTWRDEMVFTDARQSILSLTATIPALATRYGVASLESLKLALTHDFDATFDETVTTGENVEVVEIQDDGSIVTV